MRVCRAKWRGIIAASGLYVRDFVACTMLTRFPRIARAITVMHVVAQLCKHTSCWRFNSSNPFFFLFGLLIQQAKRAIFVCVWCAQCGGECIYPTCNLSLRSSMVQHWMGVDHLTSPTNAVRLMEPCVPRSMMVWDRGMLLLSTHLYRGLSLVQCRSFTKDRKYSFSHLFHTTHLRHTQSPWLHYPPFPFRALARAGRSCSNLRSLFPC